MIYLQQLNTIPVEKIPIQATIETALCAGAGGSSGSLADQPIVRSGDDRLLIPGSQLKGRVRHECEKLARGLGWEICHSPRAESMCPQADLQWPNYQVSSYEGYHCLTCQLFGNPTLPSRIIFDDLLCQQPDLAEVFRPGVTVNRRRGVAEDQKLYFLETSPMNAGLTFQGEIWFLSDCPDFGKPLVLATLKQITALGGSKSAGLGWLRWEYEEPAIEDEVWQQLIPPKSNNESN